MAALDDDAAAVRRAAAVALAARSRRPRLVLPTSCSIGSPRAQEAALLALRGHGPDVRETVIAWTLERLERAARLRRARTVLAGAEPDATVRAQPTLAFLCDVLDSREHRVEDLALRALVVLGAPEAGGVIRRCLRSDDPEIRAQAIEALDSIGDRRLSGALVRLLEDDVGDAQDRACRRARAWSMMTTRGSRASRGEAMRRRDGDAGKRVGPSATSRRCSLLRRVPLFERLEPEDLQRIAHDRGRAPLPRRRGDRPRGRARRRAGRHRRGLGPRGPRRAGRAASGSSSDTSAGDHIGELAVLREAPRAATVIAEGDGVRGLVIGGAGLKAILRERPDAAMAMLATLAERIGTQQ